MLARSPKYRADEGSTPEQKKVAGGHLASSAQPPRATSFFSPSPSSLRRPQPFPSTSFLDNPDALLEGLRCFTASARSPRSHRFSLLSMQQPLETNFACSPFSRTTNRTPRLFFQRLLQALALRHFLSDHRALCSSYCRHFESHPILSGEFHCFRLYDSATNTERFLPAETLEALGAHTVSRFRVRCIQAVHILDQPAAAGAQLVREKYSRQIRAAAAQQHGAPLRRSRDKPRHDHHV